ncbi:hypothetical protein GCM10027287_39820 [Bordetella muralis]
MRHGAGGVIEREFDVAPEQVGDGVRTASVGHMREFGATDRLKQLSCEMRAGTVPGRRIVEFAGTFGLV